MNTSPRTRACIAWAALLAWPDAGRALPVTNEVLSITAPWRYTTNNVDAADWSATGYDDSAWAGPSDSLFYIESASLPASKKTRLPSKPNGDPLSCYYFRTRFAVTNAGQTVALIFKHLTDDGAVFYLNGAEIQRVRMEAEPVSNATEAEDTPPGGDATSFETFACVGGLHANLVEGTNVVAVRVHQHGTASSDVVFGTQVSAVRDPAPVIRLTRGPYLPVCTPSSIVIRWRTDLEENSRVRYGTSPANLNLSCRDGAAVTEHAVTVTNLAPDALYYYAVGSETRVLAGGDASCSFRTHPLPGQPKPLRLWLTGDMGMGNADEQAVLDAFEAANGTNRVDAWLQLGDNAYDEGTDAQFQAAMFEMCADRLRRTPVWSTIGNHETYSHDWNGRYPYLNIFSMPTGGEAGGVPSHTQLYYSFDIGMAHFISLDATESSREPDGDMANWLRADLAATTSRWVIAFFHQPPYTKGSHDSDEEIEPIEMRENIVPILEAGGVDLVVCGHSHSYERSHLLNGHYGHSTSLTGAMILDGGSGATTNGAGGYVKPETAAGAPVGNQGTVYAIVGCSSKTSGGTLDHPAMPVAFNTLGSMVLDITTNRLEAIYLRETGATNDAFALVKANYAPVASNRVYRVAADSATNLFLAAGDVNRNPLSFTLGGPPTNGLVSGFSAASGAFTYTPAHGSTNSDSFSFEASDGRLSSPAAVVTLLVQPPADADGDGLPDAWEAQHGATDPAGDPDHDGATNLQEYRAATDPRNASSWLKLTQIRRGASGFEVAWPSVGGTRYRMLFSDGDAAGGFTGVFTPLPRAVEAEMDPQPPGSPGTLSFTDDFTLTGAPPPRGARYFRVSVVR